MRRMLVVGGMLTEFIYTLTVLHDHNSHSATILPIVHSLMFMFRAPSATAADYFASRSYKVIVS